MKTLRIIEWIGFALIIIGFCIDAYVSSQKDVPMSFTGPDNNYIFIIGLTVWALSYGIRKFEARKAKGQ